MHIEISAGGLRGGVAVASFQSGMKSYIYGTDGMINSFKAVASKTYNLNGGVGRLSGAVGQINSRVSTEESRKSGAEAVQKKANDFLDLAIRVDKSVATMVKQDREELYGKYPALKPTPGQWMKDRLADAWNWLCKKGEAVVTGAKQAITAIRDTLQKAWNSVVAFYEEHKELIGKIVGTVLIVVGAIAAIVAVIATGGLALAPLIGAGLTALGISATTAAAIATVVSAVVGITAVVSTLGASTMNVIDIWADKSDDATFQTWKKIFSVVSIITNTLYTIGNLYNVYKGTTGAEYLAQNRAQSRVSIKLPEGDSQLKHIFRKSTGHMTDTLENRKMLEELANDPSKYWGTDKWGNSWNVSTNSKGEQIWVQYKNGVINNGGLNETPRLWDSETGLNNNPFKMR